MDPVWHYARDGQQRGSMSFEQLRRAAAAGEVLEDDLVWNAELPNWVPAHTVPGLMPGSGSAEVEPPPPGPDLLSLDPEPPPLPPGPSPLAKALRQLRATALLFAGRIFAPDPRAIRPTPAEAADLDSAGLTADTPRRYAVWRRATLWAAAVLTGVVAVVGVVESLASDNEGLTTLGTVLLNFLLPLSIVAIPVTAVLAARDYARPGASAVWLRYGAAVAVGVPVAVAFVPVGLLARVKFDPDTPPEVRQLTVTVMNTIIGLLFYIALVPTVLSLLPAVSRACVRVKSFLPESVVPGWGLVTSIPLSVLLTLATFVLLYHVAGNLFLILGVLLWVGAPLLYLTRFDELTRPVSADTAANIARAQRWVLAVTAAGVLCVLIYLFSASFMGKDLLGFSRQDAWFRPWSLELYLRLTEYVGRSLFMTVLFADLMTWVALSVWREERAFAGTAPAAAFDRLMAEMAAACAGGPDPADKVRAIRSNPGESGIGPPPSEPDGAQPRAW